MADDLVRLLLDNATCCTLDADEDSEHRKLCSELALPSELFDAQQEAAALITGDPSAMALAFDKLLVKVQNEAEAAAAAAPCTCISFCYRAGFSKRGVRCALHVLCDDQLLVLMFGLKSGSTRAASIGLASLLDSSPALDAQIYRTPFQCAIRTDDFWGEHWTNADFAASIDYRCYREAVDDLIEEAVRAHACGSGEAMNILEICGGDGALAVRLLRSDLNVSSYSLSERNVSLANAARQRLQEAASESGAATAVADADATQPEAYACVHGAAPSLCIAAGSVLCAQVGSPADADAALHHISACLADGGLLISTGLSGTFLTPERLRKAGLDQVLRGSHPAKLTTCAANHEASMDHGFGRFQLLVLRKSASCHSSCPLFDALAACGSPSACLCKT